MTDEPTPPDHPAEPTTGEVAPAPGAPPPPAPATGEGEPVTAESPTAEAPAPGWPADPGAPATERTGGGDGPAPGPVIEPEAANAAEPPPGPPAAGGRARRFLAGVLVGAVVGGLVGGGVAVATRGEKKTVVVTRVDNANDQTGAASAAQPGNIQGILQKVEPAVVAITQTSGSGESAGSGFIISPDGVIVTNNHVIADGGSIEVQLSDGTQKSAKVLGADDSTDLAVLKIDGSNLPVAQLGDSDALQVGDPVVAIGNALNLQGTPSVTNGIVSALHRQVSTNNGETLSNMIQTNAAINPGNSGGPLVNSSGQVIGINTAVAAPGEAQNIGFAIAITPAKADIETLRQGKQIQVAYLGVSTSSLDPATASQLGVSASAGAVVEQVMPGSPADQAGIKTNDVIVTVGGAPVQSAQDVAAAVRSHQPGDRVPVTVDRGGQSRTFQVTLGVRPSSVQG